MYFMVYFKGKNDKRFSPISLQTFELFDRLAFAPLYPMEMLEAVKKWIEGNKKTAPDCKIQVRVPGTQKVIYQ